MHMAYGNTEMCSPIIYDDGPGRLKFACKFNAAFTFQFVITMGFFRGSLSDEKGLRNRGLELYNYISRCRICLYFNVNIGVCPGVTVKMCININQPLC